MVDTLSSLSIANLDASPIVANTSGVGARGEKCDYDDFISPTAAGLQSTASVYKMVRLPLYVKVKELVLNADARPDTGTALAVNVGAYWSDSTNDGTPVSLQGTVINATAFASAQTFNATFQNVHVDGQWSVANRNKPLWQALGIAAGPTGAPPAGFIDIVMTPQAAATTGATGNIGISVKTVW